MADLTKSFGASGVGSVHDQLLRERERASSPRGTRLRSPKGTGGSTARSRPKPISVTGSDVGEASKATASRSTKGGGLSIRMPTPRGGGESSAVEI